MGGHWQNEEEQQRNGAPNAAVVYMVSIYLLLIAFFVILHTISKKEEVRTAAVIGSVRVTFQRPEERSRALPSDVGQPKLTGPNREFHEHVESLFGSFLNTAHYSMVTSGNILKVTLPADRLFYEDTASLRADRLAFMQKMAELITNPRPYRQNMIEVAFEMAMPVSDGRALGQRLELRRAGTLARDLVRGEVNPAYITVGAFAGKPGMMRVSFTSRPAASTEGTAVARHDEAAP